MGSFSNGISSPGVSNGSSGSDSSISDWAILRRPRLRLALQRNSSRTTAKSIVDHRDGDFNHANHHGCFLALAELISFEAFTSFDLVEPDALESLDFVF